VLIHRFEAAETVVVIEAGAPLGVVVLPGGRGARSVVWGFLGSMFGGPVPPVGWQVLDDQGDLPPPG
jgi:hypothetical protein